MAKLNVSRRTFVKLSATTAAVAAIGATAGSALADEPYTAANSTGQVRRIRTCCRGCGKMECGVWVTVENGRAVKIEGDESAPHSMGSCCAKSVSSIQACYHPDRLRYPMKRTQPKGEDPGWQRISWEEALDTIVKGIENVKAKYGGESLFTMGGTGRIWCMSPYAGYGSWFMTPNTAVAWQVCKGPRHFSSALTSEYNHSWSASVERPSVYTIWASTPEVSNYDEAGRSVTDEVFQADTFISVDPRTTALGKEADIHLALRAGTDTALALAMCDVVIKHDLVDWKFVRRWTNAPFLVVDDKEPSGPEIPHIFHGPNMIKTKLLTQADLQEDGSPYKYMVWDNASGSLKWFNATGQRAAADPTYDPAADPECNCWEGEQPWKRYDGTGHKDTWSRRNFKGMEGQANLREGQSQAWLPDEDDFESIDPALLGSFEVTFKDGSKHTAIPVWQKFVDRCDEYAPEKAAKICELDPALIEKAALAYATRKDPRWGNGGILYQLAIEHHGNSIMNCRAIELLTCITGNTDGPGGQRGATKIDVNYMGNFSDQSYNANIDSQLKHPEIMAKQLGRDEHPLFEWWGLWGNANSIWKAGVTGDPYPVKGGVCQSGDFMNMGNTTMAWDCIKQLDFFFDIDLWHHPTSELADVILPCRHWLEVPCPRQSQGSGGALGACVPCVEPLAETWYDPEIVEALYKRVGIPWGWDDDNPYPTLEEKLDYVVREVAPSWKDYVEQFEENGWWDVKKLRPDDWGTYRRYQTGFMKKSYTEAPNEHNVIPGFNTPTQKQEIWCTIMETYHGAEDALPDYRPNPDSRDRNPELWEEYPVQCLTGRRIPVYFHSEHRQLPWCREVWPAPRCEINPDDAKEWGIEQGDWVWIESPHGKIRQTADLFYGVPHGVINCEHTWWFPECPAPEHGWRYSAVNQLVNNDIDDPHCGSSIVRGYPVKVYKAEEGCPEGIIADASDPRLKQWLPVYEGRDE